MTYYAQISVKLWECVHVYFHVRLGASARASRRQRITLGTVPQTIPVHFFFLRHGIILTKSTKYGGWPASPRDPPASAFSALILQACSTTPEFLCGFWVLNSSPQALSSSFKLTERIE